MNRAQRRALLKPGARRYFERQRRHDARAAATAPVPDSMLTDIGLALHASLLSLQTGQATESDANNLALAANVSLLLCELGVAPELTVEVIAAQTAVVQLMHRASRIGRHTATGPELTCLNRLGQIHDEQLADTSCATLGKALAEIRKRAAGGHVMQVAEAPAPARCNSLLQAGSAA